MNDMKTIKAGPHTRFPSDTPKWQPFNGKRKCSALNIHGERCRKYARWQGSYHGDIELYHTIEANQVVWVHVYLCPTHASAV